MSPLIPLERLRRLNSRSPKFPDRLKKILGGRKYRDYVSNLQGTDSSPLVQYLEQVGYRYRCLNSVLSHNRP